MRLQRAAARVFRDISKMALVRKSKTLVRQLPREVRRVSSQKKDYEDRPPIIVNSLPKSGTHLLMQLALAVPAYVTYGTFIATTPSITMRRRHDSELANRVMRLVPGEVCGAHLYYSDEVRDALRRRGAVSLFIYRDPHEVFWSEMQYLLHMNRWHRSGRIARRIADPEQRFRFFLEGFESVRSGFDWPSFSKRVMPYLGWLSDPDTFCCRYEDFQNPASLNATLAALAVHLQVRSEGLTAQSHRALVEAMLAAIRPEASHTFRSGQRLEWQRALPAHQLHALEKEVAGLSAIFARDDPAC
jgi:hypothetical protein